MNAPLSPLSDPVSLAKLQVLLVPVRSSHGSLSDHTYGYWNRVIKRHTVLRGDELTRPTANSHSRGTAASPRARFLPASSSSSISRGGAPNHVHLAYPTTPPAKHLANLSLLRLAAFPLIVLGIAVGEAEGYDVNGLAEEDEGDIGAGPSHAPTTSSSPREHWSHVDCFADTLAELFPPGSPFPLVKRLIVFPPTASVSPTPKATPVKGQSGNGQLTGASGKGRMSEALYAPAEGIEAWVGRLLGEVVGDVLGELGDLATALETPQGLKTLSSTLLPTLTSTLPHPHADQTFPSVSTSDTPSNDPHRPQSAAPVSITPSQSVDQLSTKSMEISLTRALTPGGRPTSIGPPSLPPISTSSISSQTPPLPMSASSNPFRRSTAIPSPFARSTSSASLASTASGVATPPNLSNGTKHTSAPLHGLAGGRLLKLLGDMYLLAGMYSDAVKCYDDGAERCRAVGDVLWEALAREGRAVAGIGEAWEGRDGSTMTQAFPNSPIPVEILTHFLSALACLARAPLPYPPTILSPSPQAVSGTISFTSPTTPAPGSVGTGEGLLAWLHTGLALRISHFLLLIWASGGWGSIALSAILSHSLPRSFPAPLSTEENRNPETRRKRNKAIRQLSNKSGITRHSIFDHAESALSPHHRAMTKPEQLALHVAVVWLARWLDLPRKEACITREVVKRVAVMVVEAREENRRVNAAACTKGKTPTSAFSDASVGLGLGMAVPTQAIAVRRKEPTEGNTGVIALFERALTLMGIDLLELHADPADAIGGDGVSEEKAAFGWPELQVEMMKEGIAVAEALPDSVAVVRLCTSALNVLHSHLNPPSQAHVAKMFPAALAVVRRRGLEIGTLPWWIPGKVVLSLEIASLPPNRLPVEHSASEIRSKEGKRDPFLYNPRLKAAEASKTVLVANEQTDVFVTLKNPFAFDLDIQNVSLVTSGSPFTTTPLSISLPPNAMQTVRVTGLAPSPGRVQIRGIALRLTDGSSTQVLLPALSDKERSNRDKRASRVVANLSKSKNQGMQARWSVFSGSQRDSEEASHTWLECKVVEEQPLLWIKKTNLTHGAVMLYNGETSTIKITLENSSSTPVDFLKLSFEDSASRTSQSILSEGDVSGPQAYELEYDMAKRPVFTWEGDAETAIPPGARNTIAITCLGKVGCIDGSIRIDYGYLKRTAGGDGNDIQTFQTRHITFPVLFTVYHTLEPHSLDLIKLLPQLTSKPSDAKPQANGYLSAPAHPSRQNSGGMTPRSPSFQTIGEAMLNEAIRGEMDNEHCLLGLSVRNVYAVPFEVSIARAGETQVSVNRLVPPGATERIYLPVPRISLSSEEISRPIPNLAGRQYVVDKTKRTAAQIAEERELFWYRENLLSELEATWIEPGSRRSGVLSLRDQVFSKALLGVLKRDDLEIELSIAPRAGSAVLATEFTDLSVTIKNLLDRPFRPYVRLESAPSSAMDVSWTTPLSQSRRASSVHVPTRNVVFDGGLSATLEPILPGDAGTYSVGAIFLSQGTFSFRAAVEEVQSCGTDEPRVWFSPHLDVDIE